MIFVFQVEPGILISLDTNIALWSVSKLKELLFQKTQIPADKQVLLISGGIALDRNEKVCTYTDAGGADEASPIFLFSTLNPDGSALFHHLPQEFPEDPSLIDEIRRCETLPDSTEAINARCRLALRIHDHCTEILVAIERLVKDQLLQQQGWMAAVANLEDYVSTFQRHLQSVQHHLENYQTLRVEVEAALQSVDTSLQILDNIPLLPSLLSYPVSEDGSAVSIDSGVDQISSLERQRISLLQWLDSKDAKNSNITQLSDYGHKLLGQLDQSLMSDQKVEQVLKGSENNDMKYIKGITERLAKLEQCKDSAKRILDGVGGSLAALTSNQKRLMTVKDPTVLPELCNSHKREIVSMLQKMNQLAETRTRLARAKAEMCENLVQRLRWLIYTERNISDVTNHVLIQQKAFEKLKQYVQFVGQIRSAPELYKEAVREIIRRRNFVEAFNKWRDSTESSLNVIEVEEIRRRQEIFNKLSGHFLSSIFKPLAVPPPDHQGLALPHIASGDSDSVLPRLKDTELSWLAGQLNTDFTVPQVTHIFGVETSSNADLCHRLMNMKKLGCELRSAVEELKLVIEDVKSSSSIDIKLACENIALAVKATEEVFAQKVLSVKRELESLSTAEKQCLLERIDTLEVQCSAIDMQLKTANQENNEIRKETEELKELNKRMELEIEKLKEETEKMEAKNEERRKEVMLEHELELEDLRSKLDEELQLLRKVLEQAQTENKDLLSKVEFLEAQSQEAAKNQSLIDSLIAKHREEMELKEHNMRTEVEESLNRLKEGLENAHKAELEAERQKYEELEYEKKKVEEESEKRMCEEKNRIEEMLREKESEIKKLTEVIHNSKSEGENALESLRKSMEAECLNRLETQRQNLSVQYKEEIDAQRRRFRIVTSKAASDLSDTEFTRSLRVEPGEKPVMNASVIVSTPPSPRREKDKPKKIDTSEGAVVTVEYDQNRNAWFVVGNTDALHLVHTDCTAGLGDPAGPVEAKIIRKECCVVRKDGNRYNLPRGKQFYRIRVERVEKRETGNETQT